MFEDLSFEIPSLGQGERYPQGAGAWIAHIREQDMPAFGATVAAVRNVTGDERASASRLSQVILQDAALTTKVLKLANSAFHNPSRQSISTISRAIVVLGFDLVAEIALGVSLVDVMLKGGVRRRVAREMARGFHAAVQARAIAQLRKDHRAEEIFIATLLARVGEMAFWCFGSGAAEGLDGALARAGTRSEDEVQVAELGFRLHQLSVGLAREWRLGSLLTDVLEGRGRPGPAERTVMLGQRVALAAEQGWTSPALEAVLQDLGEFSGASLNDLRGLLARESEKAAQIVIAYGALEAAREIPVPSAAGVVVLPPEDGVAELPSGPDPMLQLRILRELSGLIGSGCSLSEVIQLALEGVLRGIGMGRVLFALVTANRQQVVGKSALGKGGEALVQQFVFTLGGDPNDLFNALLTHPRPLNLDKAGAAPGLRLGRLRAVTGEVPACLAPVLVQGRIVGMVYADHGPGGNPVDGESFDAFCHFAQQISFAFSTASSRRP